MKSKLKFGNITLVLTGSGRSRKVAAFDYTTVAAGRLVGKLSSTEINSGHTFDILTPAQHKLMAKWVKPPKGTTRKTGVSDHTFPSEQWVMEQFAKHPTMHINEDGDISNPMVTQSYVEKFCSMNHLTY